MEELDRLEPLGDAAAFAAWFYGWKERAIAGELHIRVLVARDHSSAIVVADPSAPLPRALAPIQMELEL